VGLVVCSALLCSGRPPASLPPPSLKAGQLHLPPRLALPCLLGFPSSSSPVQPSAPHLAQGACVFFPLSSHLLFVFLSSPTGSAASTHYVFSRIDIDPHFVRSRSRLLFPVRFESRARILVTPASSISPPLLVTNARVRLHFLSCNLVVCGRKDNTTNFRASKISFF
jgi:hypothetical protein